MSDSGPSLVVRGSNGLCLQAPPDFNIHPGFGADTSKSVKVFSWSRDGVSHYSYDACDSDYNDDGVGREKEAGECRCNTLVTYAASKWGRIS